MKEKIDHTRENSFLEGSIFGALIRFAVPVLGALILQAAYSAVDLMVVGLATPITTLYGILFFVICFARLRREENLKNVIV